MLLPETDVYMLSSPFNIKLRHFLLQLHTRILSKIVHVNPQEPLFLFVLRLPWFNVSRVSFVPFSQLLERWLHRKETISFRISQIPNVNIGFILFSLGYDVRRRTPPIH